MKILVVDDNAQNRDLLCQLFAGVGHQATAASNGADALTLLEQGDYRLIVSDILMPRMDGFQLCREVKGDSRWSGIPFLVYTATYTDPKDEAFALSIGADRFLVKPAEPAVLLTVVADLVAAHPSATGSPSTPKDESNLLQLYNERLIQKLETKVIELDRTRAELQRANDSLRESEARRREIFQNAGDGIYLISVGEDGRFRFEDMNPAGERICGFTSAQVCGRTPEEVFPAPAAEELAGRLQRCVELAVPISFEETRHASSGPRFFQTLFAPVRDQAGGVLRIVAVSRDITPQREAEEARRALELHVQQTQKQEALGTLAGGIAHDFNNILTAILGHAELLKLDPLTPGAREGVNDLVTAALRARDLVQQILTFSRRQPRQRQAALLGPIIEESLRLIRASAPASIRIESRIAAGERTVMADSGQIHQVIVNLCTNAVQAMESAGGTLTISLDSVRLDTALAEVTPPLAPGSYTRITVQDTGSGMDAGTLNRIFEPFFTTKAPGIGTGLGLAVVYGILHAHDAATGVESEPGKGTTFTIWFPVVEAEPAASRIDRTEVPRGRGQHILITDDEPALCRLAGQMLEHLGYKTTLHTNPKSALADFTKRPEAFDVVFTDLTMPDLTGLELAKGIWAKRPQIPVLLTSGYAGAIDSNELETLGFAGLITKPYTVASLAQAIRDAVKNPPVRRAA
jgi:PAS domain S-box-containing protein